MKNTKYVLIIAVLYFIFCFLRLKNFNFNPSYFVCAGKVFCEPDKVPLDFVVPTEWGFDGQFYYRLSLNPFTSKYTEFGIKIDSPPYRHQRIVYPLLVWLLSLGGKPQLVPWMMIFVNYIGVILIGMVSLRIADKLNFPYYESLVIAFYPGFILTMSRNLTEIVASLFVLLSILMFLEKRYLLYSIVSTLAVLTKETTLFISICILFVLTFYYKEKLKKIIICILPIVVYVIWQIILYFNWRHLYLENIWYAFSFTHGRNNFGILFNGVLDFINSIRQLSGEIKRRCIIILLFVSVFIFSTLVSIIKNYKKLKILGIEIIWFVYFILMMFATNSIWVEDNILRVFPEFFLVGFLILAMTKFKLRIVTYILSVILWFWLAGVKISGI